MSPRGGRISLLPIGERPLSTQFITPQPPSKPTTLASLVSIAGDDLLPPPPISKIFQRQRAGSAPSPILVDRDSRDINSYNITVTPRPTSSVDSTPTTGNSDYAAQTFPETPDAFSPLYNWTPGSTDQPPPDGDYLGMAPAPQTPMSAALPHRSLSIRSTEQQSLARAATTSVRGGRHAQQPSSSLSRSNPPPPLTSVLTGSGEEASMSADEEPKVNGDADADQLEHSQSQSNDKSLNVTSPSDEVTPVQADIIRAPSSPGSGVSQSSYSSQNSLVISISKELPELPAPSSATPPSSGTPVPSASVPTPPSSEQHRSSPHRPPPLIPDSLNKPVSPSLTSTQSLPDALPSNHSSHSGSPHASNPMLSTSAPQSQVQTPTPALTPTETIPAQNIVVQEPPPVLVAPPFLPPSPRSAPSFNTPDPHSFPYSGLPPAYDTIVYESPYDQRVIAEGSTPSTSRSVFDSSVTFSPSYSPSLSSSVDSRGIARATSTSSSIRRPRVRPPLPAGPRRPSHQHTDHSRQRNGSISSITSSGPQRNPRHTLTVNEVPLPSPRFQAPPLRWRGYTMDAAKWTFSSGQLQNIVSRAIKQSAEASSIRLLRLETLDRDIPEELQRLEMLRTDTKTKYKMLTRRRGELFRTITSHLDGSRTEDPANTVKLLEDLRDITTSLDKHAEELHSADEQILQLTSLRDVHSASALAMALRKLNASFLKQVNENQELRTQVDSLEAERDEAWKHAESLAGEFDVLQQKLDVAESNLRSSRVMASRKSSIRVSKAGLRSARSSMSSTHRVSGVFSGTKSTFSVDDAPPLPPMPIHRPGDIRTDLPTMSSAVSVHKIAISCYFLTISHRASYRVRVLQTQQHEQ